MKCYRCRVTEVPHEILCPACHAAAVAGLPQLPPQPPWPGSLDYQQRHRLHMFPRSPLPRGRRIIKKPEVLGG